MRTALGMSRKKLNRSDCLPYHVTARSNNRETFPVPIARLWRIIEDECLALDWIYEAEIHAFVLMPNHFHMLVTAPKFDLGKLMNIFMSNVTRTANLVAGRSGHVFGGPYFWSLIQSTRYYGHAFKYVYRNPVKAGLCERTEDYPYSSLRGLSGLSRLGFPIEYTRRAMELNLPILDSEAMLSWLNRPFPKEAEELIARGMKLRCFDELKNRSTRRVFEELSNFL